MLFAFCNVYYTRQNEAQGKEDGKGMSEHECSAVSTPEELVRAGIGRFCAALGVFDGVHLGHRSVLARLGTMARVCSCEPVVITFSPHPKTVLDPENAPRLLIPTEVKRELLRRSGIRAVLTLPFTRELAARSAEEFLEDIQSRSGGYLRGLCVGRRFRCGRGGEGTSDRLAAFAQAHDLVFDPVPEVRMDGETVSSSSIRQAMQSGDLEKVRRYQGRPAALYGTVERGFGIAGTELAAPTANLRTEYGILPPNGVYAAKAETDGKRYEAAVNIGTAPTYTEAGAGSAEVRVEVHLLDFRGDLYGKKMAVELFQKIREERKFETPDLLKEQIARDTAEIRIILKEGAEQ